MQDKKSYLQKLADQLHQWDAELDELKARADKAKAESKTKLLNEIDELRVKKETAQSKLKQLQEAGDEAWDDVKVGVERSWAELKGAFSKASAKLK